MITIDRSSSASIHDQVREQLRFQIASGRYEVDRPLPSTRKLADQLGISFHTVRKVYQELEAEGLLESHPGRGFVVRERTPLAKSERMERGAAEVERTLKHLIGLGLAESEIDYLFQEQLSLLEAAGPGHKLVAAFAYREMADLCAEQIQEHLQQRVVGATFPELPRHRDADFIFTDHANLKQVMAHFPRADVVGIVTHLRPAALDRIARLLDEATLGVVTRFADAIPVLTAELRASTSFSGQMIAASMEESAEHLKQFIDKTDLLVYTPACRRRLLGLLGQRSAHELIRPVIAAESLQTIRRSVPV